ncbi:MAG: LLM class flavin-dependent oxidoreductase [Candidatus Binatia bacterium]
MDVSLQLIFQNFGNWLDEREHVAAEQRLAEMAEPLGFSAVFVVEHHFFDYSACPDNAQFLAWLAARTSRIKLATGAFILPWNTPVRVAEKIVLLDHLSGGRAVLGLGRGLAKREYAAFGIAMAESRDRFDEAAAMILDACDSGVIAGDGPYYPQPRTEIRPRPLRGFRDRLFAIGMSQESVEQAARLGARLAIFSQMPWPMWKETNYAAYQNAWRAAHGSEPPPPLTTDIMYCGESDAEAEAMARRHMVEYYASVLQHYEIMGDHFQGRARLRDVRHGERDPAADRPAGPGRSVPHGAELRVAAPHPGAAARALGDHRPLRPQRHRPLRHPAAGAGRGEPAPLRRARPARVAALVTGGAAAPPRITSAAGRTTPGRRLSPARRGRCRARTG